MLLAALILFVLGIFIGVWTATLLWRAARDRFSTRRILTPAKRRLGYLAGVLGPTLGVSAILAGEWVRRGFEFSDDDRAGPVQLGILALCLIFAAGSFWAGLRFDPARGRTRCGKCWYDMSGAPTSTCPECGRVARTPRDLHRTRRSFVLMTLSVIFAFAALGTWIVPRVKDEGWRAAVPSTLLILTFTWAPETLIEGASGSLDNRYMWEWQHAVLRWKCRGVLSSSTRRESLRRAAHLFYPGYDDPDAIVRPEVVRSLFLDSLTGDAKIAEEANTLLEFDLSSHVPDTLDNAFALELVPLVERAMADGDLKRVGYGVQAVFYLGEHSKTLIPHVRRVMEQNASPNDPKRDADGEYGFDDRWSLDRQSLLNDAFESLCHAAQSTDVALAELRALLDHPNVNIRAEACHHIGHQPSGFAAVEPRLRELVNDPDDFVAFNAAVTLLDPTESACSYYPLIIARAEKSDSFAADIITHLLVKCRTDDTTPIISHLLNSQTAWHQEAAIDACQIMTDRDRRPFLAKLRELAVPGAAPELIPLDARILVDEIEAQYAIPPTKPTDDERPE